MPASAWFASSSAWTHASRPTAIAARSASAKPDLLSQTQFEACLDGVGADVVGVVDLTCQQPRDPNEQQCVRPATAPGCEELERELRVCAHPRHSSLTAVRAQEDQPGVHRRAAVG